MNATILPSAEHLNCLLEFIRVGRENETTNGTGPILLRIPVYHAALKEGYDMSGFTFVGQTS